MTSNPQKDLKRVAEDVLRTAAASGTRLHKRISWGLTVPSTERTIVLGGDYYADNRSGYLLAADVPVLSGYGRADLVLYLRQNLVVSTDDERSVGIWRPVMVLDVKTKTAFDCGFVGRQVKSTDNIVADATYRKSNLSNLDWNEIIDNTPSPSERRQVKLYSRGLIADYQKLTNDETPSSSVIVSGILIIDESLYPSTIRKQLTDFVIAVYERIRDDSIIKSKKYPDKQVVHSRSTFQIDIVDRRFQRIAIVTLPIAKPTGVSISEALPYPSELSQLHISNPFRSSVEDKRRFILYASGGGRGAGEIASWIARYWHGIDYTRLLARKEKRKKILWLDLAGEFSNHKIMQSFIHSHPPGEYSSDYLSLNWNKDQNRR
ncbi:MAG: hypothetical protein RTU30_15320, partial [Candidatus Thorarchaeota archaeon]